MRCWNTCPLWIFKNYVSRSCTRVGRRLCVRCSSNTLSEFLLAAPPRGGRPSSQCRRSSELPTCVATKRTKTTTETIDAVDRHTPVFYTTKFVFAEKFNRLVYVTRIQKNPIPMTFELSTSNRRPYKIGIRLNERIRDQSLCVWIFNTVTAIEYSRSATVRQRINR